MRSTARHDASFRLLIRRPPLRWLRATADRCDGDRLRVVALPPEYYCPGHGQRTGMPLSGKFRSGPAVRMTARRDGRMTGTGPGCVKTRNLTVFGCRFTPPE